jgi:hypothetical protein
MRGRRWRHLKLGIGRLSLVVKVEILSVLGSLKD